MQAVMGDYEKDRQGQLARNRAVLAQMGLLNHATTAEMRAPQPRLFLTFSPFSGEILLRGSGKKRPVFLPDQTFEAIFRLSIFSVAWRKPPSRGGGLHGINRC